MILSIATEFYNKEIPLGSSEEYWARIERLPQLITGILKIPLNRLLVDNELQQIELIFK